MVMNRAYGVLGVALALLLTTGVAAAELRLPKIFADHGVFQRDRPVPVWGWADAGATVSVSMADQKESARADGEGRWRVDLDAMAAGGPHTVTVTSGNETITLDDILVGEVWLASGQSNMQWPIKATDDWEAAVAASENDNIRFAMVFREHSPAPLDDLRGLTPWASCNPESLMECCNGESFSAVSYYFAKFLQEALEIPVGVINTSWGGTRIEPWTPPVGFEKVPALADIDAQVRMNTPGSKEFQAALKKAIADTETWLPAARGALQAGAFPPALPQIASSSALNTHQSPTTLYNAMVHPLVPYANRGFIWYQGESNRGEGMLYRDKMEALIKGWRAVWDDRDLACHFVQLAPYNYGNSPQALPEIWEAQIATLDIPNTGMAVTNDISNLKDIHPRNKLDVGKRLALQALNKTYGRDVICDGPIFDHFEVEGDAARVYFKHAKALETRDGAAPDWFAISGPAGIYKEAEATIDGATVVLRAEGVTKPVAVRFAWDHLAEPNLMNEAGLPASAFRAGSIPVDGAVSEYVPQAKGLEMLYAVDVTKAAVQNNQPVYTANNAANLSGKAVERTAYFLLLAPKEGDPQWAYCEMDAFTQNLAFMGIPIADPACRFQQRVDNLVVRSNVPGIATGKRDAGAVEIWSSDYSPNRTRDYEGASSSLFDIDDAPGPNRFGYGSLQVHDLETKTPVLCYNNHRMDGNADAGIGKSPGEQPDWTFSGAAANLKAGKLLVLVKLAK